MNLSEKIGLALLWSALVGATGCATEAPGDNTGSVYQPLTEECGNEQLTVWESNNWRLSFDQGEVITFEGERYQANQAIHYPNAECAPDNPVSWCSNWFTQLGACEAAPSATCDDGILNQGEESIDCGGPCDACFAASPCSDGVRNQGEDDVDCGGPCDSCAPAPACDDGVLNQGEDDIDCGGPCDPCNSGTIATRVPAKIEAEDFDDFFDSTAGHAGNCGSGPVDQQETTDVGGGCNIGWTTPEEWVQYEIEVPESGAYDLTLRLAARDSGMRVSLSLNGHPLGTVVSPGNGWQSWEDRSLSAVDLPSGTASLRVTFLDGGTNLNWLQIEQAVDDVDQPDDDYRNISLSRSITHVQPMTGIVLWNGSGNDHRSEIQLEYSYVGFDSVATSSSPENWNWSGVESLLDDIASHGHQAILRFYFVYPGASTRVPEHIKNLSDYSESNGKTEGQNTWFPDWSHSGLKSFSKTFYSEFAQRYDNDPRMAFLQVGFGLWGEYHIYEPGVVLGANFPDMAYQEEFIEHLDAAFSKLHWSISIDAASSSVTPFASAGDLRDVSFGLFDDSFLHANHGDYNNDCFEFFGQAKRLASPVGGEFSYYSSYDQEHVLNLPDGPHGTSFEELAARYNLTYIIGNDQPSYQPWSRIEQAGMATGYHFEVVAFSASSGDSRVTVRNSGIAPIYYDAYPTVDGVRSTTSLKGLLPGTEREYTVSAGGSSPTLTIESDRLVSGQEIQFDAQL